MSREWDPSRMGYGRHEYHHIDPSTINVDEFARNLRGEEQHFGDVRQYNSAYNEKHPENDLDLDWLGRTGTVFETEAPGWEGIWHVTNMPVVRTPIVLCRAVRVPTADAEPEGEEKEIPCVDLGSAVDTDNKFRPVRSRLLKKGSVDRKQRLRLTKRS